MMQNGLIVCKHSLPSLHFLPSFLLHMQNYIEHLRQTFAEKGEVSFAVRVRPAASRTEVTAVMEDGSVKISVKATPEGGKANAELQKFLAKEFRVKSEHVKILSGGNGRRKVIQVRSS